MKNFFLKGLGDYEGELQSLFSEIRTQLTEGNREDVDELSAQLEEILYGVYEEYPWAASSFWHYPPNANILSVTLTPQHPYLKNRIWQQWVSRLPFMMATSIHYSPLVWKNGTLQSPDPLNEILRRCTSLYLSVPESLEDTIDSLPLTGKPITRVNNFYDFVNGFHQRNLFYANIATTGDITLEPNLTAGEIPISIRRLDGKQRA